MKESIAKYILIDPKEIPTKQELGDAVKRLRKDLEIMGRIRSKRDPNPEFIEATISFLDLLMKNDKIRNLRKEEKYEDKCSTKQTEDTEEQDISD